MQDFDDREARQEAAHAAGRTGILSSTVPKPSTPREIAARFSDQEKWGHRRRFVSGLDNLKKFPLPLLGDLESAVLDGRLDALLKVSRTDRGGGLAWFIEQAHPEWWLQDVLTFTQYDYSIDPQRPVDPWNLIAVMDATRVALGVDDLALDATARYGRKAVLRLLQVVFVLRHLMLERQAKLVTTTGYGGQDEWLDRSASIHFVSTEFAMRFLISGQSPEAVAAILWPAPVSENDLGLTLEGVHQEELLAKLGQDF